MVETNFTVDLIPMPKHVGLRYTAVEFAINCVLCVLMGALLAAILVR
jgi:hypothetical protein